MISRADHDSGHGFFEKDLAVGGGAVVVAAAIGLLLSLRRRSAR